MAQTKTAKIEIRVTASEKEKFQQIADSANISISNLIRNAVLSDRKIVLLSEGGKIAKGIGELIAMIHDSENCEVFMEQIGLLMDCINQLADKLSDICDDVGEICNNTDIEVYGGVR